ncbi:MAG: hypothetical protein Q7V01_02455 [Vicinamibacterales bacterium]|nr:hypothetical protein [Vicinamibacterales bacterium]
MTGFVLAGVLGAFIVVGSAVDAAGQSGSSSPGAAVTTRGPALTVRFAPRPSAPFSRLFPTQDGQPAKTDGVTRFYKAPGTVLSIVPDPPTAGPCGDAKPARQSVDPRFIVPPRDQHLTFTIHRVVPEGCIR